MSTRCLRLTLPSSRAGARLDEVLGDWLPGALGRDLSKSAIRRLVMVGAVAVDGRPVRRPGMLLEGGRRLEAKIDLDRLVAGAAGQTADGGDGFGGTRGIAVLYRDRWLLAVAKPPGLLVHASADARRPDLVSILRDLLSADRRDRPHTAPYLGVHHRLDVETSGVMLFTIEPSANAALARAFAGHEVRKQYHALVSRPGVLPPDEWVDSTRLALVGSGRRARMTPAAAGGQAAETAFRVRERLPHALLIEARPASGRKHQIRAHLAARRMPVLGDVRYAGAVTAGGLPVPRVMLHARSLGLQHPVLGTPLEIRCPHPADFRQLLVGLGGSLDSLETSR